MWFSRTIGPRHPRTRSRPGWGPVVPRGALGHGTWKLRGWNGGFAPQRRRVYYAEVKEMFGNVLVAISQSHKTTWTHQMSVRVHSVHSYLLAGF